MRQLQSLLTFLYWYYWILFQVSCTTYTISYIVLQFEIKHFTKPTGYLHFDLASCHKQHSEHVPAAFLDNSPITLRQYDLLPDQSVPWIQHLRLLCLSMCFLFNNTLHYVSLPFFRMDLKSQQQWSPIKSKMLQ